MKTIIFALIISLCLNSVVSADIWTCFTPKCTIGKNNSENHSDKQTGKQQKQRTTTIWNQDGTLTIINEDPKTGRTDVWYPDGSHSIMAEEEK